MTGTSQRAAAVRCLWLTKGLGRGGVERLLVDMLPLVDTERFAVDVAYVLPWKDNFHRDLEERGATVRCLGASSSVDPRWVWRLARLIASEGYDLVHTHAPVPAIAARAVTVPVRRRPAIIHTEHNMWDRYRLPTRLANSITYHRNRAVVAVSDTVARTIRPPAARRAPPVTTIHHGTVLGSVRSWSDDERRKRRRSLGLPPDSFLVGNVGNFTPKKDHRNLLAALAGDGPIGGAHLALVGLGPLEDDLRQAATEFGVAERTTFLGSRDDVFDLLGLFDAFCLSSQYEGFPIALVEAMASGLPCVATSVGGVPEIVSDGTSGLLVQPRDHLGLRAAIERVMSNPELARRCSDGARAAAERLDLRFAVGQMEAIYLDAVGHPS